MNEIKFLDLTKEVGKPACAFLHNKKEFLRFIGHGVFTNAQEIMDWPNTVLADKCLALIPKNFFKDKSPKETK